jgi:rare lipoprotein A
VRFRACAVLLGVAASLGAAPAPASPRPNAPRAEARAVDLEALRAELDALTAPAEAAAEQVVRAAARSARLRAAMDRLAEERDAAQARLDARARALYMRGRPDPLAVFAASIESPDLALLAAGGLRRDRELVEAVEHESLDVVALRLEAEEARRLLLAEAVPVFEAQDRARELLERAEAAYARDQAVRALLAARRRRLDAVSRSVTLAVAPAVTARGRRAAAAEAPVVEHLERTCCGMPPGYHATGRVLAGEASWYGPGFVGNPTASGAPYDPERLTAAMLPPVPLGTVVRVTTADGLAVNVLVNDRGPYAHGRVIDLSRAAARRLGFSGVTAVRIELLEPD